MVSKTVAHFQPASAQAEGGESEVEPDPDYMRSLLERYGLEMDFESVPACSSVTNLALLEPQENDSITTLPQCLGVGLSLVSHRPRLRSLRRLAKQPGLQNRGGRR